MPYHRNKTLELLWHTVDNIPLVNKNENTVCCSKHNINDTQDGSVQRQNDFRVIIKVISKIVNVNEL